MMPGKFPKFSTSGDISIIVHKTLLNVMSAIPNLHAILNAMIIPRSIRSLKNCGEFSEQSTENNKLQYDHSYESFKLSDKTVYND